LAEALAQRAQVVAKARYDLPPMIDAIERVYREVTATPQSPTRDEVTRWQSGKR